MNFIDLRHELAALDAFNPDEPRLPAGETGGGQWTKGGGHGQATGPDPSTGPAGGTQGATTGPAGGGGRGDRSRSVAEAQAAATRAAGDAKPLAGLPQKPIELEPGRFYVPGPIKALRDVATAYMAGKPFYPPTKYARLDKERATRVAQAFEEMKHAPNDPEVRAAYKALADETIAQWQAIKKTGLKVEWIKPGMDDPYAKSPRLAAMDVADNNHWWGFPTDLGFGSGPEAEAAMKDNPLLAPTGEVIDGRKVVVNDVFRIVHDLMGHFKEGVGFRATGEENAWRVHSAMFSPLARKALTSETRGQNSWVNYGPHGEFNRTASAGDTHYAPQKVGLMPDWAVDEGAKDTAWTSITTSYGDNLEIAINPNRDEVERIAQESTGHIVRFLRRPDTGDVWAWDGYKAAHGEVWNRANIDQQLEDDPEKRGLTHASIMVRGRPPSSDLTGWVRADAFNPNEPRDETGKWTAGAGAAKKQHTAATAEWKTAKFDVVIPAHGKAEGWTAPMTGRVVVNPSRVQAESVLKSSPWAVIRMGRDKDDNWVLWDQPETLDNYVMPAIAKLGHEIATPVQIANNDASEKTKAHSLVFDQVPPDWFAVEESEDEASAKAKAQAEREAYAKQYEAEERAKRWPPVGQERPKLKHADTPGQKYIRFGLPPKNERSEVGAAPNAMAAMTMSPEDWVLEGVSVFRVNYNKAKNTWEFDDDGLADSGYASLDELLSQAREHRRPIFLMTGDEQDEEGTDGEPLLRNSKIIDKDLSLHDVSHEGYYDPEIDVPEWAGEGYSRHAYVDDGTIYTNQPADAALAEKQGRKVKLVKPKPIPKKFTVAADFDESQHPRGQPENAGQFVKGAGSPAKVSRANEPSGKGIEFVSPNLKEGTKVRQARIGFGTQRHKLITTMVRDVDKALGMNPVVRPVYGMWADGAENSTMSVIENPPWETLVASAAMKGWLAKQKQVLIFKEGDTDPKHGDVAGLATFHAKGKPEEISQWLAENGLPYHTLEPIGNDLKNTKGWTVYVYGNDDATGHALTKAGEHYGSPVDVREGRGAFLGTHKEDGSDADQRADARAEFDRLLGQLGDQKVTAIWQGIRDRYGKQADEVLSDQTDTPHFKAWFGDSKVVDDDGAPLVLHHGTLGDFKSFDQSRANVESDWGAGIYFTNDPEDLSHNYAGRGPDAANKLENLADHIEQEDDFEGDHAEALQRAEKMLDVMHEGASIPVFVKMEKPFKVGGRDETFLDLSQDYNEETEEYGDPHGKGMELIDAISEAAEDVGIDDDGAIQKVIETLQEHMLNNDGIQASKLQEVTSQSSDFAYLSNSEGKLVGTEILRRALQKIGFDGVIDSTVSKKFPGMKGMKPTTTHYIVFDPHQVKSAIGNKGTFDPKSTAITDSQPLARADAYNPNEPRIPKGQPGAGQWTTSGGGGMGFIKRPPDKQGEEVWDHPKGILRVKDDGSWRFAQPDGKLDTGEDEESLNKWLNDHKADLQPPGGPLIEDLAKMGFEKDNIHGYWHEFKKGDDTFEVDERTGDWMWRHKNGSEKKGTGEHAMLTLAANWLPEADPLLAALPALEKTKVMVFTKGAETEDGGTVWHNAGGGHLRVRDSGRWAYAERDGLVTARGNDAESMNKWLEENDAVMGLSGLGFTKDDKASNDSFTVWRNPAGVLRVQNATGQWKFAWSDGSKQDVGPNATSLNAFTKERATDLAWRPAPVEPTKWEISETATKVGGDDWNKATAERLEKEFVAAAPELDTLAAKLWKDPTPPAGSTTPDEDEDSGDDDEDEGTVVAESWDDLSGDLQEKVKDQWIADSKSEFYDSETENWADSGQPLEIAKKELAAEGDAADYVLDAVDEFLADAAEAGEPVPYTKDQLLDALIIDEDFSSKYDDGKGDLDVTIDSEKLGHPTDLAYDPDKQGVLPGIEAPVPSSHFTEDMSVDLLDRIRAAFDKAADKNAGKMDPPDYLWEQAEESAAEYWDQFDDEEMFKKAKDILSDEELGQSAPEKSGDGGSVETLDHPPAIFDPLNKGKGANYRRTQHISKALSVERGVDLLAKRGLVKNEKWVNGEVGRIDDSLWQAWIGSSTSEGGKLLQIASADELGGRARVPPKPDFKPFYKAPPPATIMDAFNERFMRDGKPRSPLGRAIERGLVSGARALSEHDSKAYESLLQDQATGLWGYSDLATWLRENAKVSPSADDPDQLIVQYEGLKEGLRDSQIKLVRSAWKEISDYVTVEAKAQMKDTDRKRVQEAEGDAKAAWGGFKPTSDDLAIESMQALPSPEHMRKAFNESLAALDPEGRLREDALYSISKRMARNDFWRGAITKKGDLWSFDPAKFDVESAAMGGDPAHPNGPEYKALLDTPQAREKLAAAAMSGFHAYKDFLDQSAKSAAITKFDEQAQYGWETADELRKSADKKYDAIGGYAGLKALVRAKWETTQWLLAKAGVHDLHLYRGIQDYEGEYATLKREDVGSYEKLPDFELTRNGAASTSTDPKVANEWKSSDKRIVLRFHVPRTAAISVPSYGKNVQGEHEVVIIGTAFKGWDAWKTTAPTFSKVPLATEEPEMLKEAA